MECQDFVPKQIHAWIELFSGYNQSLRQTVAEIAIKKYLKETYWEWSHHAQKQVRARGNGEAEKGQVFKVQLV
jgi:hypothetical protein